MGKSRLLPEDEGQGQGLRKRVEKAQKSCCRKCQGDSAWTGSEMTELLQEPSWSLGARICSGLTSVVSHVSPGLHGQPEVGAKKETVESWCPLRTGNRNDRRSKGSDRRVVVSAKLKWLTVGGRPDGEAVGGQIRVMDRKKRGALGDWQSGLREPRKTRRNVESSWLNGDFENFKRILK